MFSRPIILPCLKGNAKKQEKKSRLYQVSNLKAEEHYEKPKQV